MKKTEFKVPKGFKYPTTGVYTTEWGNTCEYIKGENFATDLDMREEIPLECVDFRKRIRDID